MGKEARSAAVPMICILTEGTKAELCLWDTAGQEKYAQLLPLFVCDTDVAVIVASYTDYQSIEKIDDWIEVLKKNNEKPEIVVVINKTDMANSLFEAPEELGNRLGSKYTNIFFTSAKTGSGIERTSENFTINEIQTDSLFLCGPTITYTLP